MNAGASRGRATLLTLSVSFLAVMLAWAVLMIADLHDGRTWEHRRRPREGPRWYQINADDNPRGFRTVIMLRAVMPLIFFGTISGVCLIGAFAQPPDQKE